MTSMEVGGSLYDVPSGVTADDKTEDISIYQVVDSLDDIDSKILTTHSHLNEEVEDKEEEQENYYSTSVVTPTLDSAEVNHSAETIEVNHSSEVTEVTHSAETTEVNHSTETTEVSTTVPTMTSNQSDDHSISSGIRENHVTADVWEVNRVQEDEGENSTAIYALHQREEGSEVDLDELVRGNEDEEEAGLHPEESRREESTQDTYNNLPLAFASVTMSVDDDRAETSGDHESNLDGQPLEYGNAPTYDECISSPVSVQSSVNEHVGNVQTTTVSNGSVSSSRTTPVASGTFVMRSVGRADPLHVVRRITQSEQSVLQPNPELDELVTIIKGNNQNDVSSNPAISIIKQRIKSWLTSPLVSQFNKESETGSEVGVSFAPKGVGPAGSQSSYLTIQSQSRTSVTDEPQVILATELGTPRQQGDSVSQVTVVGTKVTADLVNAKDNGIAGSQGHLDTAAFSMTSSNEQQRSLDIAKALEVADFKPTVAPTQPTAQPRSKSVTVAEEKIVIVNKSSSNGEGLSVYSKQTTENQSPIKKTSITTSPVDIIKLQNVVETLVPTWKAEVERRKQTKEYVLFQKPEQPLRMADTPDWKKQLQEKNKSRKLSTDAEQPANTVVRDNGDLEWKAEIKNILRQKSVVGGQEDIPLREQSEWERLADNKK